MYKGRLREPVDGSNLQVGYMEMDPSGRYGRFRDVLGKGAVKTVYKAFDEVLGMEVAWNQVKLNDVLQSPDELQRLYSEVHLLNNLDHDSIMRFYTSWIDVDRRTFNFISEMFASGTLREYRKRVKRVNIHAVKNWSRQILRGLAYLHGIDPPVIHRDLKCDNIFINGHLGQVKIGDLGLATILRHSQHAHSVIGTPEFMAPELYEEDYDELVDIYSFGMCVLEMLTSEYPYSECTNPAQIYKKVTSGKLPDAFYRINDVEAKNFVGKCLQTASKRPSAKELLTDPFLSHDEIEPLPIARFLADKLSINEEVFKVPPLSCNTGSRKCMNMTITGKMNPEDDTIFLKVQIYDKEGKNRNVYFQFDIVNDTAHDVATEMVRELDITDYEPFEIAKMIDDEVSTFVPSWKESESSPYNRQHSFNYDEDDDDERTPFSFYSSSHSSSQASLPGHFTSRETQIFPKNNVLTSCHDWFQEDLLTDDDTTSQNSLGTYKSSDYHCCSDNEVETPFNSKAQKCTRFCPEERMAKDCKKKQGNQFQNAKEHFSSNDTRRISRIQSLVDIRSQLQHRTLLEEIKKRRMFKTVGAVENIGYHEPVGFSRRSSPKITRMQRFEW